MPAARVGAGGRGWERDMDVVPVVPGDAKPGGSCSGLGPCGGDSRTSATCQHAAPARRWHGQGRSAACPQPPREYCGEGTGHAESQGRRAGGPRSCCRTRCSTPIQKQKTERAWDRAQVSLLPLAAQGWGLQPRRPSRRGQERPQNWGLGSEHPQPSLAAFPSMGHAGRRKRRLRVVACPMGPKPTGTNKPWQPSGWCCRRPQGLQESPHRPEGTSTACCGRDVSAPRILKHSRLSIKTNIKKT